MGEWRVEGGQEIDGHGETLPLRPRNFAMPGRADRRLRLREDDLVLPGLADFHLHMDDGSGSLGIDPADLPATGVLLAADAGTRGWEKWRTPASTDCLPLRRHWVSLLARGMWHHPRVPRYRGLQDLQADTLQEVLRTDPDALGVKVRLGQHDAAEDRLLLRDGVDQARAGGVPLMVHVTGSSLSWAETLDRLVRGDVVTHVFHGRRGSLLEDVFGISALRLALAKGVVLDVGHGANHFAWSTFHRALQEGIRPTMISTDLTRRTWRRPPVYDLPYVCSKLLAAGLTWPEVYSATVTNPSAYLGLSYPANAVVVMRFVRHRVNFPDAEGVTLSGRGTWRPVLVAATGRLIRDALSGDG